MDADSDAFHYIGHAESNDLIDWTVINGLDNPFASVAPTTLVLNEQGVPTSGGWSCRDRSFDRCTGRNTLEWFAGRVCGPSATRFGRHDVTVVFAGYHTQKPRNGLGDYRTIGRFGLRSSERLRTVGNPGEYCWDCDEGQ